MPPVNVPLVTTASFPVRMKSPNPRTPVPPPTLPSRVTLSSVSFAPVWSNFPTSTALADLETQVLCTLPFVMATLEPRMQRSASSRDLLRVNPFKFSIMFLLISIGSTFSMVKGPRSVIVSPSCAAFSAFSRLVYRVPPVSNASTSALQKVQ